jgi:endonuclease YncB( thermonuclease family)
MRLLPVLALTGALLLALPAAAPAASRGPCVVGTVQPRCDVSYGAVPYQANDGDTLDVRIDGRSGLSRVRISGVNAQELTDYGAIRAGECHATDAAVRLDELLDVAGRRVRLAALDQTDLSRGRLLRSVAIKIGGRWIDVGQQLIEEGHALPLPFFNEWAGNAVYATTAQIAQRLALQGLWRADACGAGPEPAAQLKLWVSSDPAGDDREALDEESVTVRNVDPARAADLSGWVVRDSALNRYTFAPGTVLAPSGGYVTLHVGHGTDTATDRYWGHSRAIFGNAVGDERVLGDGGYLFDPEGDLRQAMVYPCQYACSDPLEGELRLRERRTDPESVTIENVSGTTIDLFGYRLFNRPFQYAFPAGTVLGPGEELRVVVQGDPAADTRLERGWGLDHDVLGNKTDRLAVQTFDGIEVACDAWGSGTC